MRRLSLKSTDFGVDPLFGIVAIIICAINYYQPKILKIIFFIGLIIRSIKTYQREAYCVWDMLRLKKKLLGGVYYKYAFRPYSWF